MRTIQYCELVTSAPDKSFWPESQLPEIVLAGRSNVGKSSFINTMVNRKKLAYVGNTPGKTRLLNFFNIDDTFLFVDVPGYGYANISKRQLQAFGQMMEDYFGTREQKIGLVLLVDARHKPSEDDITMMEYARYHHLPVVVVATKIDKLKRSEISKKMGKIASTLEIPETEIVQFSSETSKGREAVWKKIDELLESVA